MVLLYLFIGYINTNEQFIIKDGPMTMEQCRKYMDGLDDIRSLYKATGAGIICAPVDLGKGMDA